MKIDELIRYGEYTHRRIQEQTNEETFTNPTQQQ